MLIFANNAETTTLAALTSLAMYEVREEDVGVSLAESMAFGGFEWGEEMHVTISDPANAPGVVEIATLTGVVRSVGSATFTLRRTRNDEYPAALSWSAGAKVEGRVTAEMLGSFVQTTSKIHRVHAMGIKNPGGGSGVFAFDVHPVVAVGVPVGSEYQQQATGYPAGTELIFRTQNVDIGVPPSHSDSQSYYPGAVVTPVPANGRQYQLLMKDDDPAYVTGAVTFPDSDFDPVNAFSPDDPPVHAGWWVPTPEPVTLVEQLPGGFVVTEVGFLASFTPEEFTTPAVVSIGTDTNGTLFLDHGNLTGAKRIIVPVPDDGLGIHSVVFTVHSHGEGASIVGSFYFKGFRIYFGP